MAQLLILQILSCLTLLISYFSIAQGASADFIEQQLLAERDDVGRYVVRNDRQLTPEEEQLANQAKAEIVHAIEDNLVKILTVIAAENERNVYFRQDEDDDDILPTPNPNVLPQVAQILGAIFSGTLNITRILDSTVGLVPNIVQNQFQHLIKLVTGENVNLTATSTLAAVIDDVTTTSKSTESIVIEADDVQTSTPEVTTPSGPLTTTKKKYMINRIRNRTTTIEPPSVPIVDDELVKLEEELRTAGHLMESESKGKEPRIYAGLFNNILAQVNMTTVAKAVPSIFKGATQAFTMLENLGVLGQLPGGDILSPDDEKKDEEE